MLRIPLVTALCAMSHLAAADFAGNWIGIIETKANPVGIYLTLHQHDQNVWGMMATSDEAKDAPIKKAQLRGDELSLKVRDGGHRIVKLRLKYTDGTLSGQTSVGNYVSKITLSLARSNRE